MKCWIKYDDEYDIDRLLFCSGYNKEDYDQIVGYQPLTRGIFRYSSEIVIHCGRKRRHVSESLR